MDIPPTTLIGQEDVPATLLNVPTSMVVEDMGSDPLSRSYMFGSALEVEEGSGPAWMKTLPKMTNAAPRIVMRPLVASGNRALWTGETLTQIAVEGENLRLPLRQLAHQGPSLTPKPVDSRVWSQVGTPTLPKPTPLVVLGRVGIPAREEDDLLVSVSDVRTEIDCGDPLQNHARGFLLGFSKFPQFLPPQIYDGEPRLAGLLVRVSGPTRQGVPIYQLPNLRSY